MSKTEFDSLPGLLPRKRVLEILGINRAAYAALVSMGSLKTVKIGKIRSMVPKTYVEKMLHLEA